MQNELKASLTNLGNRLDIKFKSALLTISVGQVVHEGEKFKAVLELTNKSFNKCTIAVCDTLQRHSLAILSGLGSDDLYTITKKEGDQWIDRNNEYCNQYLTIPFEIIRWDKWIYSDNYPFLREKVNILYRNDQKFNAIVQNLANQFNNRLTKRGHTFDFAKGIRLSIEYLLEECAAMCQWYEEGYCVEIYPSVRNDAIEYCFSVIMKEYYNYQLLPAGVSFKKNNIKNALASAEAMKKILDMIPGHVYWKDSKGRFLGCNKQQADNYGFRDINALIGKKDRDFLKEEIAREIEATDQEIMSSKQGQIIEEETYISDGKKRIRKSFLSHKIPMISETGEVTGIIGVSIDVSLQKKLQQNLIKKTEELSAALAHKKDFLNILSHEIRTPLHVISSIVNELYKNIYSFSKEEINSFIIVLAENNRRLMKLLTHLLDSAKNLKGETIYNFKNTNIIDICLSCIREFSYLADISLVTNEEKELPALCDEIKISQVIRNILDNAVKYGTDKTITMNIDVTPEPKNIVVKVENTGRHLQKEEEEKLFELFFQGEEAKKLQNGVGLGLAICKEIITAHKGKIWVENVDNRRVSFNFTIPYGESR